MSSAAMKYMPNSAKPLVVSAAVIALAVTVYIVQRDEAQQLAERDARCQQEQANPSVTFQKSADCIIWRKPGNY